jgi:hypothetical protein
MAIMDLVTYATVDGASMGDYSENPDQVICSSCSTDSSQVTLALWGFERSKEGIRHICPTCVRVALPQIEALLPY